MERQPRKAKRIVKKNKRRPLAADVEAHRSPPNYDGFFLKIWHLDSARYE
jgi:hypothetical protein